MIAAEQNNDALEERRRAAEMTIGEVSGHIRQETWPTRSPPHAEVGPREAWKEAEPVHYPSAKRSCVARYHPETDTLLLARQGGLVTVLRLMDRPWSERIYIRNQVTDE